MHELPIISQEDALAPRHRQACGGAVRFLATCSTVEALRYEPELMSSTPPPAPAKQRHKKTLYLGVGRGTQGAFLRGRKARTAHRFHSTTAAPDKEHQFQQHLLGWPFPEAQGSPIQTHFAHAVQDRCSSYP